MRETLKRLLRRRAIRIGLCVAGLAGAVVLTTYLHWAFVQHRLTVVSEGRAYSSSDMPPEPLKVLVKARKIDTVIDFRKPKNYGAEIAAERAAMAGVGVRHINLPTGQVPTQATVSAFLAVLDDPETGTVLMHCHHGYGRAVLFSALYRIEKEGWTPERARRATRVFTWGSGFAMGRSKGDFLGAYVPRREHESPAISPETP